MNYTARPRKRTPPPWLKPSVHYTLCFFFGLLSGFSNPSTTPTPHPQTLTLTLAPSNPIPITPPIPVTPTHLLILITTTRSGDHLQRELLQRLARTLRLVPPPLLWIVVERHEEMEGTADVLRNTGILYRHLTYKEEFKEVGEEEHHQRNVALSHVEHHRLEGIVCFAEASNVYNLGFFDEIRGVDVFGVWHIAMVSVGDEPEVTVEGPVCNSSLVVGWNEKDMDGLSTRETRNRTEVNVWGFGFNSSVLWDPERWGRPTSFPDTSQDSMRFIHEAVLEDKTKVKAIPSSCSRIMLWHLQIQSESSIQTQR